MHVLKSLRAADTRGPFTDLREKCRKRSLWKLCLVAAWCGPVGVSAQTVVYVDQQATGPVHDGSSWCTAYVFLQDALAEAEAAGGGEIEVRVADGVYKPDRGGDQAPGDRTATFQLLNGVALRGGFAGCGAADPDARNFALYETILSGDLNGDDDDEPIECTSDEECWQRYGRGLCRTWDDSRCAVNFRDDNVYYVVLASGADESTLLEGVTVRSGTHGRPRVPAEGGGMSVRAARLRVVDCTFVSNHGTIGGGISLYLSTPTLIGCVFEANSATYGGGLFSSDSDAALSDCVFRGNDAMQGGAMYLTFTYSGKLVRCLFIGNVAPSGGAIYNDGALPTLDGCKFLYNTATFGGGAVYNRRSAPTLLNCVIAYNTGLQAGGGIFSRYESSPMLTNCTFAWNSSPHGSTLAFDAENRCRASWMQLTNSVLWNDGDDGGGIWNNDGSELRIRHSNVKGGWPGAGNIDAYPLFVDPDGPDDLPGTADDDFRLLPGSPCIDAGSNDDMPSSIAFDLDSNPRFAADPAVPDTGEPGAVGPPIVDMGAYEYQAVQLDILPGLCPNRVSTQGNRLVSVAIVGTSAFDVTHVDLESLVLRRADGAGGEVLPLASQGGVYATIQDTGAPFISDLCQCHTDRKDGRDDLVLRFSVSGMVDLLELDGEEPGSSVMLTLSGTLTDAKPFEASDCIVVPGRRDGRGIGREKPESGAGEPQMANRMFEQQVKLTASDAAMGDWFGFSVSISSDTVIVGAPGDDDSGSMSGSAYIFRRGEGGPDRWAEIAKLTAADAHGRDRFGISVAISGDTAIVGAFGNDTANWNSGSAYVFQRDEGGAGNWRQVAKLTPTDATGFELFGISVAIDRDTAIVGASEEGVVERNAGRAYIFRRDEGGQNAWGQVAKLTASDAGAHDWLGCSVAISGNSAIVGALRNDEGGTDAGSAYIFERDEGGPDNWGEVAKLTASDAAAGDSFGLSVAIGGDTAIVGAFHDDDAACHSGAVYIFRRDEGDPDTWDEVAKLTVSNAVLDGVYERLGLGIRGDTAIVGARLDNDHGLYSGSARIFQRDEGGADKWGQVIKLTAIDADSYDWFGGSVAIGEGTVIAGAMGDDNAGEGSGAAYVFFSSAKPGRMSGGGSVFDGAVRFTHRLGLSCDPDAGAANLQIDWRGNSFRLTELDSAWCSDDPNIDESPPVAGFDTLEGTGTGFLNGVPGATIAFTLTDAGEPGRGVDYAEFVIEDEGQLIVLSGTLLGGNHQAHGR